MVEDFRFKVNLGGMIDILSNHLYSSPNVFIRELLQNGVDAIKARQKYDGNFKDGIITITLSDNESTITFKDNGIGLTEEEIHQFLSIIGASSKKDLITGQATEDFIGRFGIGLLSCFMVTDEIQVLTKSIKNSVVCKWVGKPDGTYTISKLDEECDFGTTIILKCKTGSEYLYNSKKISELVKYYGGALLIPIYLNHNKQNTKLNNDKVIWDFNKITHKEIIEYGERTFESKFIDYIPLTSKSGDVMGVAYIISHKVATKTKNTHRIYLKNMLLSEKGDNLLPDWAFFVKCIINSNVLRPIASREGFYEDDILQKTREELGECITNYFLELSDKNPRTLAQIVSTHDLAIKSLSLENDRLYQIFFDYMMFETSFGRKTGKELISENSVIQYTDSVDQFRQISSVFTAQNKLLVNGGYVYLKDILEKLPDIKPNVYVDYIASTDLFQVMEELSEEENDYVEDLIVYANSVLGKYNCNVDIKQFKPYELPAIFLINDEALYYKEILLNKEKSSGPHNDLLDGFIEEFEESAVSELCLNYNNPLIQKLLDLKDKIALKNCLELIYVQSLLLGHYPLGHNELQILNTGIITMIEWGISKWKIN